MEKIELTGEYSDFIGSYSCAYNSEFCSEVINAFDYYTSMDAVYCEDGPVSYTHLTLPTKA